MRIGVNAVFLEPGMGGLETYVREVVPRLAALAPDGSRVTVVCNERGHELLAGQPWAGEVDLLVPKFVTRSGFRAATELTILGAWASSHCDVLLSPALTSPLSTRAANVVLLADVTWILFPDLGDGDGITPRIWRAVVPAVARRADRVIALTEVGARELVNHFGIDPGRIDVIGLGFDAERAPFATEEAELRARLGLGGGPVVLNVGAKKVHKNQVALVEAVGLLSDRGEGVDLVLPGAPTEYDTQIRRAASAFGVEGQVFMPGFVEAGDLEGLYSLASCLAFPSLNEGFGLPLLEAMARDLPVVCSDTSVLPEVVGDAAMLVDPKSAESIANGISRVLGDAVLRERLVDAGRERIRSFTWDAVASLTLNSLVRAIGQEAGEGR